MMKVLSRFLSPLGSILQCCGAGFPLFILMPVADAPAEDKSVAGSDQVADIIENYEGRGALSDGSDPTPPEEALKGFALREGFEIELVASEPDIGQPLHISWDSKGRMWVTQYLQYQFPAGLKIVEYDNHLRAQFDKVPEPPPHGAKGADKVTVFEDTTGDGRYDSHRDVITGLNIATSAVHGAGGIWVTNPPYLLFYPDADGDAEPDGDPEVKLSGFGLEDTHAVANSLKWGPDGWLYGACGSTTTGSVENPATGERVEWQGQMVWRYHPATEEFEIWAEGGGNTFSLEIDSAGRIFSGTNNGSTRGMHYPQGSYGKKSWGKHGPLTNPYAFGYFDHMKHQGDDRRFAQAFCIYEGGLYGEEWEGKVIAANSLHNLVWVSELLPDGSTFRTVDEEPLVTSPDRWFRPVFAGVGPDGCVYLADWYDTRLSHVRPVDDWHKDSGRIYRIVPTGTEPKIPDMDFAGMSPDELMAHFDDPNWVVRKRALLELGWGEGIEELALLMHMEIDERFVAFADSEFAGLAGGIFKPLIPYLAMMMSLEEQVRDDEAERWAIRYMSQMAPSDYPPSIPPSLKNNEEVLKMNQQVSEMMDSSMQKVATDLKENFLRDPDLHDRAQLAAAAKQFPWPIASVVVEELLTHDEDLTDPHIPLLIWWAIEAHAEDARGEIGALAADPETWKSKIFREVVAERLARRYAMAGGEENFLSAAKLLETAPDEDAAKRLMTGIQLAFQGADLPDLPPELTRQMEAHASAAGGSPLVLALQRGDKGAVKKARAAVESSGTDPVERIELVRLLGESGDPSVVPVLLKLLGLDQHSALKRVVLQALARYDDPEIPKTILARHGRTLPAEHGVRSTAHLVLAGRVDWAAQFLEKVERAHIKAGEVSPDVIQLLARHGDSGIDEKVRELWPNSVAATSEANRTEIERIKKVLAGGKGDADAGKVQFAARCASCHQLFGEGQKIGPDLTPYERQNLDFWLPAIVDPSLELREGFLQYVATMKDGRIVIGMMEEQSPRAVTLRDFAGQSAQLSREEIGKLEASPVSAMPPGLLAGMSDKDLRDLFAYLMKVEE